MNIYEAICSRRTIREFLDKPVSYELLKKFVDAGRLAPQAANRQPLEFLVVDDPVLVSTVFTNIKLAGYLDWKPAVEARPRAYVVIVSNKAVQNATWVTYDVALASENISLVAWAEGVGSCLVGAFNKQKVTELLAIPETHELMIIVALGYPAHKSVTEELKGDDVKYWRDADGTFHVPKRPLQKILHHNKF